MPQQLFVAFFEGVAEGFLPSQICLTRRISPWIRSRRDVGAIRIKGRRSFRESALTAAANHLFPKPNNLLPEGFLGAHGGRRKIS